ncbi:hypothetical protein [Vibrio mediterranei]|uniref:hypothetical protein n=1 Tax=Vibrio mediterranei TaxID=689 RepID=UPI004068A754
MNQHQHLDTERQGSLFPPSMDSETEFWFSWTREEVIQIQKAMLKQALSEVRDGRRSKAMREEAWNWLMSDDDHPFCSRICAANNGLDIDILRCQVRRLVRNI